MIQPQELRYKNLVNYQGETIEIHGVSVFDAFNSSIGDIPLHCLEPIPLTEEWLLKAGFELYDYEPNEEGDEFPDFIYMSYKITPPEKLYYYTITNTPEDGGYFDFCIKVQFADYVMLNTLQYVHQLQNLYFALTGKELEFKL